MRLLMLPPFPDYVPGPEHPPSPVYVPGFVLEPVYPEFMPPEDDVLPVEEQPLHATASPTVDSPRYIRKSDPEEDPKEDDKDPEEDPADYPTDKEEEEEPSKDDIDDEEEDEDEEDEEHPAPANSIPPPPVHRATARISIPVQAPAPFLCKKEVERLLTLPTLPPSPLTPYSLPLTQIPSPPLPASPTYLLGYKVEMIRLRAESPSTSHPLPPPIVLPHTRASMAIMRATAPSTYILAPRSETPPSGTPPLLPTPLPTSSLPLILPFTNYRADVLKVTLPPRKRLCIALYAEIRHDPDREIGYRITDVWEDPDEIAREIPATDVAELGKRMTDFVTTIRQDTDKIYGILDDAHDDRLLMSGQLNMLRKDRHSHARIARLMESDAKASHKVWVQSMNVSDTARIADTLAAHEADRSQNGKDSHDSGTCVRRQAPPARECTYLDFMKCKPLYFKGSEGVVELTRGLKEWKLYSI
nr:hypothetical protein [Tanacetum cinerariifolium]